MQNYLSDLLRFYSSMRNLLEPMNFGRGSGRSGKPFRFQDVNELGEAVAAGTVGLGDTVRGTGWLSPYAYWYLPKAYSPYRFVTGYATESDRVATKMTSAPALLPAGHVPFKHNGKRLAFLYPGNTLGFNLELSDPSAVPSAPREFEPETIDDQPWFYSLDFGHANYSMGPERWVYSHGDTDLSSRIILPGESSGTILPDPTRVREVVAVPTYCKPIPVLYPEELPFLNQHVELTARLIELDADTLGELSRLGAPLTERVFSLFFQRGASLAPFCLSISATRNEIRRTPDRASTPSIRPKFTTLLTECFFEDAKTGEPVAFGDDEIIEWFIPSIKDLEFAYGQYIFPDRWLGKLYGFDGPIYVYKTGPLEISISPSGALSAYMISDISRDYGITLKSYQHIVSNFRQRMKELYRNQHGHSVKVVNTFMTDTSWQGSFGKLLGTDALDEAIRYSRPHQELLLQLQRAQVEDKSAQLAPIISVFTTPVTDDVSSIVGQFDKLRHNSDLLPLNTRIFNALALPNWSIHDPKDFGTDHLVYASASPKVTVAIQMKSHKEIVEEDDIYDKVLSQRAQSSAYNADLYLIFLYGNPLSEQKPTKKSQAKQTEGQIVEARFKELKRKIERTEFRRDTEVVSPETLAQIIIRMNVSLVETR